MNELELLAQKYGTDKQMKHHAYTPDYYKRFVGGKDTYENVLEIGVREGWSIKMWEEFFTKAKIWGIDNFDDPIYEQINFKKEDLENNRVKILIGDQGDDTFLKSINTEFDVIIDDGSHRCWHHQISFRYLFPKVKSGGWYVIEDLETAFIRDFREYDDFKSSTIYFLRNLKKDFFSYYIPIEESQYYIDNVENVEIIDQIAFIKKK